MSEPITNVEAAVAALGALPVPQGPAQEVPDGEHYAVVHHAYRVSHDLPEGADAPYVATPETHSQMRAALTRHFSNARTGACENCGSVPEDWCPECAACEQGCFGGFDGNSCSHSTAKWGGA